MILKFSSGFQSSIFTIADWSSHYGMFKFFQHPQKTVKFCGYFRVIRTVYTLSASNIFVVVNTFIGEKFFFFFFFFETWKVKVFIKKLWESVGKVALPGTPVRSFLLWQCTDLFLIFIIHKVSLWTCRISSIFSRLSVEWLMQ